MDERYEGVAVPVVRAGWECRPPLLLYGKWRTYLSFEVLSCSGDFYKFSNSLHIDKKMLCLYEMFVLQYAFSMREIGTISDKQTMKIIYISI